jgi:hypothetical protein
MITIRTDVECPIKCGNCCIDCELGAHTDKGCSLDRKDRPYECNAYMCGEGTIAYNSN